MRDQPPPLPTLQLAVNKPPHRPGQLVALRPGALNNLARDWGGSPSLVPSGWTLEARDKETRTRRFVSPDGRASFTTRQMRANRNNLRRDIDRIATQDGEQITYLKRGTSWIAVSGYRDGAIFYRKSNLACDGSRWNQVELLYPQDMKRAMDSPVTRIAHGMTNYSADCN